MDKPNVIYVYHSNSTFIQKDVEFFRERYTVKEDTYNWNKKYLVPLILLAQFFRLFRWSNSRTVYVVMFAGFWSVIPVWLAKVFGRRSFLIVGGTDCVSFPEFSYGSLRKPLISKAIHYSLSNCTTIVPVANQLIEYDYSYFNAQVQKQGYRSFFPDILTRTEVIYNGYELPEMGEQVSRVHHSFLTVAKITNSILYELKGIDLLKGLAEKRPELEFTIVGISDNVVSEFGLDNLENLKCVPFVGKEDLDKLFRQHQFYTCLSLSEGFPNALSEGMSYGCVPIGSDVSSIPFIIGDTGFVLKHRSLEELEKLVDTILDEDDDSLNSLGHSARERISSEFSLQKRRESFYHLIESN